MLSDVLVKLCRSGIFGCAVKLLSFGYSRGTWVLEFIFYFLPIILQETLGLTTVFVDTRLWKTKHTRKHFQNFRQSYTLSTDRIEIHQSQPASMTKRKSEGHTSGCNWWISIRSVDNTQDWRKFWKRFCGCFVFQSRVSIAISMGLWSIGLSVFFFVFWSYLTTAWFWQNEIFGSGSSPNSWKFFGRLRESSEILRTHRKISWHFPEGHWKIWGIFGLFPA